MILSAAGADTVRYAYAAEGRPDMGDINVSSGIYALASLRNWKAAIVSIDTSLNPSRSDTVHRDSVSFAIRPGDTTFVSMTVAPRFSVLRARLVSNAPGSIANNVKWVRIRVDDVTRDSARVGTVFRFVDFGNSNTGCAVGEAGTVVKTTSGTTWSPISSATSQNLNGTYFTSTSNGWAVGDAGTIIKSTNGASFTAQTSGTAQNLNGVYFTSKNNGNVVGDGGVILKTTNSGGTWTALASGTARNLNNVFFIDALEGYAVGDGGVLLSTADGTNWTLRATGTVQNLYGMAWSANASAAIAVGALGALVKSTNGTSWSLDWNGAKSFDEWMTYKYLTPDVPHTPIMQAIDVESGSLRGYQANRTLLLAPGKDTTVTPASSLMQCGYGGATPACTP